MIERRTAQWSTERRRRSKRLANRAPFEMLSYHWRRLLRVQRLAA